MTAILPCTLTPTLKHYLENVSSFEELTIKLDPLTDRWTHRNLVQFFECAVKDTEWMNKYPEIIFKIKELIYLKQSDELISEEIKLFLKENSSKIVEEFRKNAKNPELFELLIQELDGCGSNKTSITEAEMTLLLQEAKFFRIQRTAIKILEKINELDASNNNKTIPSALLDYLPNLQMLSLSNNPKLTSISFLTKYPQLTHVDLSGCTSLRNIVPLADLPNLQILNLSDCELRPDAIRSFFKAEQEKKRNSVQVEVSDDKKVLYTRIASEFHFGTKQNP